MLRLRNPHSVLAALETRPQDVHEIRLHGQRPAGAWIDVVRLAEARRIAVLQNAGPANAGRRRRREQGGQTGRTAAAEASVRERNETPLEQFLAEAGHSAPAAGLWLALDQIQDPHNVGAIFRTAAFFDVQGIVVSRDRSAPLNSTVYDVASGGIEYVPYCSPPNLSRALDVAKKSGLWVLGTSEHAEQDISEIDRDRPWLVVLGNEEKGLRRLTEQKCDALCRLTPRGGVKSLNVSVAAGILMARLSSASPIE